MILIFGAHTMNFFFANTAQYTMVVTAVILLAACSSAKKPPKESDGEGDKINVQIMVSPDANLNSLQQPAPIRLDLYQLSADGEFNQADFFELTEKPEDKLAAKLIQHNQYMLHPDAILVLPTQFDSNLKYLGVVGSYRNLDNRQWRLTLLKQEKRWYEFGGNYLYIYVGKEGLSQLSQAEMKEKLEDYQLRNPQEQIKIKGGKVYPSENNLDKGIFRRIDIDRISN